VALAADKVYASEVSLIGSVGVIAPSFLNFTKLLDKVGVEALTLSAGKGKDAMNPLRPWKEGEQENYSQIIDYYYNHFVDLVTKHRPQITKEKLVQDYGAHVFPAPQALERGFIDFSGLPLSTVMEELVKQSGITTENYQVIRLANKGWWNTLFSTQVSSLLTGKIQYQVTFSPEIDILFSNQFLFLYRPQ
jgi:protease IV